MEFNFSNTKISGIHTVFPSRTVSFDDEIGNYSFSSAQSRKLKTVMGFDKRRVVDNETTSSDLAISGFLSLSQSNKIDLETIDALIVVTQTPDYLMPGTSFLIHNGAPFRKNILTLDLNQGCCGFITGLITGSALLQSGAAKRVALVNVDVLSRLVSANDRNSRPIVGDAASITILDREERGPQFGALAGQYNIDSSNWSALKIPAGGMKIRPSESTGKLADDGNGNLRAPEHLVMDGEAVFDFVMKKVPKLVSDICLLSGVGVQDIDHFLFHQPNKFMLKKLAEILGVGGDKVPMGLVEEYGNSSGATIPATLSTHFKKEYFDTPKDLCFAGFGVGLTWGGLVSRIHELNFLSTSTYEKLK